MSYLVWPMHGAGGAAAASILYRYSLVIHGVGCCIPSRGVWCTHSLTKTKPENIHRRRLAFEDFSVLFFFAASTGQRCNEAVSPIILFHSTDTRRFESNRIFAFRTPFPVIIAYYLLESCPLIILHLAYNFADQFDTSYISTIRIGICSSSHHYIVLFKDTANDCLL